MDRVSDLWPPPEPSPQRAGGTGTIISLTGAIVVLALVVGLGTGEALREVRSLLGFEEQHTGAYAYLQTQPGDDDLPVTYPPCKSIRVAINPEDAPADHRRFVRTALTNVANATGLRFRLVEDTDERPGDRELRDEARYGPGYSPILVSWADADEVPALRGDVAGIGGSVAVTQDGWARYVTGSVTLDEDAFEGLLATGQWAQAQAIVDHEFAHVVGLAHVDTLGELMTEKNTGQVAWGPGDLAGLDRLGRGRCS